MKRKKLRAALTAALSGGVLVGGLLATTAAATAATAATASTQRATTTLWVAPTMTTKGESAACKKAKYHTIPAALKAAKSGDTVEVCAGTYTASTTITTGATQQPKITTAADVPSGVHLAGQPGAKINAKGLDNGITFFAASGASASGFSVTGAIGEGILAILGSNVIIKNNVVEHNDNGTAKSSWNECKPSGHVPGDCGEGIHLLSVADSQVLDNTSMFNLGGVLLTDEFGPNHGNTVSGNLVEDNEADCGITVVSHNPAAVNSKGVPQPSKGGTFDNTISDNVVISNGTAGFGGGVLLASGVSGGGSYYNTVTGNEIVGNGISGVTIHQHAPLSDVSGDVIANNWIGTNDITGDPGTGDTQTTGVLVDNGGTHMKIKVTVENNTIAWDTYGIFDHASGGLTQHGNVFFHVKKDVES